MSTATMCRIERPDAAAIAADVAADIAEDVVADNQVVDTATGDEMVVTVQETHYTFDVDAETEPVASEATDDFVSTCLANSFNSIHDPAQYRVISVEVESEIIVPDSSLLNSAVGAPIRACTFRSGCVQQ
jgi:hypothetical protein